MSDACHKDADKKSVTPFVVAGVLGGSAAAITAAPFVDVLQNDWAANTVQAMCMAPGFQPEGVYQQLNELLRNIPGVGEKLADGSIESGFLNAAGGSAILLLSNKAGKAVANKTGLLVSASGKMGRFASKIAVPTLAAAAPFTGMPPADAMHAARLATGFQDTADWEKITEALGQMTVAGGGMLLLLHEIGPGVGHGLAYAVLALDSSQMDAAVEILSQTGANSPAHGERLREGGVISIGGAAIASSILPHLPCLTAVLGLAAGAYKNLRDGKPVDPEALQEQIAQAERTSTHRSR